MAPNVGNRAGTPGVAPRNPGSGAGAPNAGVGAWAGAPKFGVASAGVVVFPKIPPGAVVGGFAGAPNTDGAGADNGVVPLPKNGVGAGAGVLPKAVGGADVVVACSLEDACKNAMRTCS